MAIKLSQMKAKATSKMTKTCVIVTVCCFVFFLIGIGSGLYSASVLNKPTPTPVAVKHFHHLYQVEGSLENEIRGKVVPKVKDIADDTVQIVNEMVHRLVRHERSVSSVLPPKSKKYWKKSLKKLRRPKREISSHFSPESLDPVQHTEQSESGNNEHLREKRRALEDLKEDFKRCKSMSGSNCAKIHEKIVELTDEIEQRFAKMKAIANKFRSDSETIESGTPEEKEMKRKLKEEKRRLKEEMKQKLQEQGLRDCSSEEIDREGCGVNIKDVFENDTNIIHIKTKIYAKPSTISTSTEMSSTVSLDPQTSTVSPSLPLVNETTTTEPITPPLPVDSDVIVSRQRSLFNSPVYRDRYNHFMGHHPPPNENLDYHTAHKPYTRIKPDGFYRSPFDHDQPFSDHNHIDDTVEIPALVEADLPPPKTATTSTTTQAPIQTKILGAHGTLLSLCEQYARNNPNGIQVDQSGNIISTNGNFQARPVSSVGQQVPQTGQSSKASAQMFVNPGFNQLGFPLCYMSQFNAMPFYGNYYGHSSPQMMGRGFPAQVPFPYGGMNYPNYGRSLHPSGPSQGIYCAFMPQANQQIPGGFGAFRTSEAMAAEGHQEPVVTEHTNVPSESDIIYASFTNKPVENMTEFQERSSVKCEPGTIACAGTGQCIETSKWCDSRINCLDASDEVACSCKARLPSIRICDGVVDCPLGDDELGCNGCDKFSFTCYNSRDEFDAAHGATTSMCYTANDRCDGFRNCRNGKDEKDCNIIVKNLGGYLSHQVSYTDGFLYRNFKGKWYPVCRNAEKWAKVACDAEIGHTDEPPHISNTPNTNVVGPFISNKGNQLQDPVIEDHCDAPTYVACPPIKCGRVKNPHDPFSKKKRHSDKFDKETVSIVGGTDCAPHQWPFIVSIFKNGKHHCGGAIKSPQWIISAAHCFHSYHKSYYEIRAGGLRHRSYSPEVQISPIVKVFVYPKYDQKAMIEDLVLIKIANPLNYNRHVRPICLPAPGRSGSHSDWRSGPTPGQVCTVMGWGTLAEEGPHPDGLKEVHLPILPTCKNNNKGKAICAGELSGGRDACQGDSGGPLLCKSLHDPTEWYLAGVVSHGEGCAREGTAGIYTRISLYVDWLEATEQQDGEPGLYPVSVCTGFKCIWGGGKCLPRRSRCNGIVECLGGEDEVDCQFSSQQLRSLEENEFKADDVATTTTETRETTMETTIVPLTSTSTSPEPETTIIPLTSSSASSETETTLISSSSITTSTQPETTVIPSSSSASTELETTVETTTTSSTTTTTTTEAQTEPETSETPTTVLSEPSTSSTTQTSEILTTPTQTSTASPSTSRDGRQLVVSTTSTPTNTTDDSGRFLFPRLFSSTTTAPVVPNINGFVPIPESTTQKPVVHNALTIDVNKGDTFHCKNIPQSINQIHRCDKQTDCEDGTDELNCTCKEFLIHQSPHKICDGHVDCIDLTDEDGCLNCQPGQFKCRLSKQCINNSSRCDNIVDCLYKEDELDCISLTNGSVVLVTPDYNPVLKSKGYLTHNHKGRWTIHCDADINSSLQMQLAGQTCVSLGFAGYSRFENITVGTTEVHIQIVNDTIHDTRRTIAQEQVSLVNMKENMIDIESVAASHDCVALWIECVPHTSSNKTNVIRPTSVFNPLNAEFERPVVQPNIVPHVVIPAKEDNHKVNDTIGLSEYQWPFSAVVFAEGKPICNGILVARQWVMIEATCLKLYKLETDYVAVLLGSSNSFLHIQGPYEVVTRVDCTREIPSTNAFLLHLEYPVYYNRYILPTYLIDSTDREVETEQCLTVSIDKFGRLRSWPVKKTSVTCPGGYKCFEQILNDSTTLCKLKDYIFRPGYVVCRTESNSWFPTGFYHNLHQICSPDKQLTVLSLNPHHFKLLSVIGKKKSLNIKNTLVQNMTIDLPHGKSEDKPEILINVLETLECPAFYGAPVCYGHRCPFGVCLPEKHVCDGVVHCHDASDECAEVCTGRKKRACNNYELTCRNGNCVDKSRFCDQVNDCGDYTDEPPVCSCFEYLKVTDPDKICDGVRNCLDKSDESNDMCRCNINRFRCGESLKCIPHDFVCDTQIDCPGGEDERYCYGIQNNHYSDGFYEVMQQDFGVWHTKCFPKSKPPTETDLIEICKKMGYVEPIYPKARARIDNDTVTAILPSDAIEMIKETNKNATNDSLPPATKAIISNKFSTLQVNKDIKLYVKPSRPLAKLVEWDKNDEKNCFRIEINCS